MKIRLLNQGGFSRFAKLDFPIEVEAVEHGSSSQGLIGYLVSASELERLGVSTFGAPLCFRPEQCSAIKRMIIILNGPPGCGKDTLARLLTAYGFARTEFKHDLYVKTAEFYSVSLLEFKERHENRELKELPFRQGLSTRQMLIHVSENVYKPRYGQDYFGRLAAARCAEIEGDIVFSDGGFPDEVTPLGDNVLVIRLHREGFTFDGDSRNYLDLPNAVDVELFENCQDVAIEEILHHAKMFRANK